MHNHSAYNDTGIVIHTLKYSETKLIVHMITQNHGRIAYITSIVKKNAKNPRNLLQPLNVINFTALTPSTTNGLHKLQESTQYPLDNLTKTEPHKSIITMMICEVIYKMISYSDTTTFRFLLTVAQKLKMVENPTTIANFHLYFMVRLSQLLGYIPKVEYSEGSYFDIVEARFCSYPPIYHQNYFEPGSAKILALLLSSTLDTLHTVSLNRDERKDFLGGIIRYYSYHSDSIHTVRSISMFGEIF